RLAKVNLAAGEDRLRIAPREPAVDGLRLVEREDGRILLLVFGVDESAVVVEEGEVVPRLLQLHDAAHDDDAAPLARGCELAPCLAVILADAEARRVEARPEDQALRAAGVDDAVDRRRLPARLPAFGRGEALAPGQPAVVAALEDDPALPVAFRVDAENRLPVLEQDGGRMPEILPRLAIDEDLPVALAGEVD